MGENKARMLAGELYRGGDPELSAERRQCQQLLARYNATDAEDAATRADLLKELFGSTGEGVCIMPRFQCDYGYLITVGPNTFVNYDAIFLDCAPITIGADVQIGPRAQLLTPLHPIDDHEARREGWESAAPITIRDNVWLGGGVIVCAGVTIGENSVIGAGSVVTRDIPAHTLAVGNPCRPIRDLPDRG